MKKIYGFLGAAALLVLASCSKNIEEPKDSGLKTQGDLFMSMTVSPVGPKGTRTATPNQTQGEVGQDRENTISNALVIFAEKDNNDNYKVVTSIYSGTSGTDFNLTGNPQSNYMATFKVDRNTLLNKITGESLDFYIFVVANAPADLAGKFGEQADVQQVFATAGDENTYWKTDEFLMSNSKVEALSITKEAIKEGTHITASDPFKLGTVQVQRAMSRFDLAVSPAYIKFTAANEQGTSTPNNSDLKDITIEFDAVALINMAQKANSFKVTAADKTALGSKTICFNNETNNNWVFSPEQEAFSTPLFSGAAANGKLTGTTNALSGFFTTQVTDDENAVNRVNGYSLITKISEPDNAYQRPSDAAEEQPEFMIWRYCMENTNPDNPDNQLNGNSTGVVFRAKITGKKVDGTAISGETDGPLYAYNNVILGNAEGLRTYVTSPRDTTDASGVYDAVKLKYTAAVEEYNKSKSSNGEKFTFETGDEGKEVQDGYKKISSATAEELAGLDEYLVAEGFSIYRPDESKNYYCYYIYWNRHNDNGNNAIMGPMEFATVRNNVYKLRVNKIHKLGHPGEPEDDPDDPTPDTPNETDSFYCEIICEILPWEVRINDIEF